MAPQERLSSEERKAAIVKAATRLFAERGLHGVTTREVAEASGVSEGLLYRHFRSKEELHVAIQAACMADTVRTAERMSELTPNTATLVLAIYFLTSSIVRRPGDRDNDDVARLLLASLQTDGSFARGFMQNAFLRFVPKLEECMRAAQAAGDLVDAPPSFALRLLFADFLAAKVLHMRLPEPPVVDYAVDHETLIEEITRFSLRGLGLKEEAIQRYFAPKALAMLVQGMGEQTLT